MLFNTKVFTVSFFKCNWVLRFFIGFLTCFHSQEVWYRLTVEFQGFTSWTHCTYWFMYDIEAIALRLSPTLYVRCIAGIPVIASSEKELLRYFDQLSSACRTIRLIMEKPGNGIFLKEDIFQVLATLICVKFLEEKILRTKLARRLIPLLHSKTLNKIVNVVHEMINYFWKCQVLSMYGEIVIVELVTKHL